MALLTGPDRDWKETARYHSQSDGSVSKDLIDFYSLEMSAQTDGPEEILAAVPKFRNFAAHPTIPRAFVLEPRFERVDGGNIWKLEVEYSTELEHLVNPLSIPAVVTNDPVPRLIVRLTDANGKPKCNTAGDIFDDPPPEVEVYDVVYVVTKNVPTKLPAWYRGYANRVNSDAITLRGEACDPGTVRYIPKSVGEDKMGGPLGNVPYCIASFELHFRADGWKTLVPNRGFNELIAVPLNSKFQSQDDAVLLAQLSKNQLPDDTLVGIIKGKAYVRRKIYVGPTREAPTEAQMLDKKGRAIAVPTPANIVLLEFDDYDKAPFNALPLP